MAGDGWRWLEDVIENRIHFYYASPQTLLRSPMIILRNCGVVNARSKVGLKNKTKKTLFRLTFGGLDL
jgi:hypothetical protein